jgi:hypothetical protein
MTNELSLRGSRKNPIQSSDLPEPSNVFLIARGCVRAYRRTGHTSSRPGDHDRSAGRAEVLA